MTLTMKSSYNVTRQLLPKQKKSHRFLTKNFKVFHCQSKAQASQSKESARLGQADNRSCPVLGEIVGYKLVLPPDDQKVL